MEKPHSNECTTDDALNQVPLEERLHEIPYLHCDVHTQFRYQVINVCVKRECPDFCKLVCTKCEREHAQRVPHSAEDFLHLPELVQKVFAHTKAAPRCDAYSLHLKPFVARAEGVARQILALSDALRDAAHGLVTKVRALVGTEDEYVALQAHDQQQVVAMQANVLRLKTRSEIDEYVRKLMRFVKVRATGGEDAFDVQYECAQDEAENQTRVVRAKTRQLKSRMHRIEEEIAAVARTVTRIQSVPFEYQNAFEEKLKSPTFSDHLKHSNIVVDYSRKTARCSIQFQNVVSLFDQHVGGGSKNSDPAHDEVVWAIKVAEKNDCTIGVGLAHKRVMRQKGFIKTLGAGCGLYMLLNTGVIECHTQRNVGRDAFTFHQGDTIYLKYSPASGVLLLSKNKQKPYVSLEVGESDDTIHPAVFLYDGCAFQIVDEFDFEFE